MYVRTQFKRAALTDVRWRLLFVGVALVGVFLVRDYLDGKYYAAFSTPALGVFVLADKLFYWFMTGFFFGIIALALLYEGELMAGLWRLAKRLVTDEEPRKARKGKRK